MKDFENKETVVARASERTAALALIEGVSATSLLGAGIVLDLPIPAEVGIVFASAGLGTMCIKNAFISSITRKL